MKRICLLLLSLALILSILAGCEKPPETTKPIGTSATTVNNNTTTTSATTATTTTPIDPAIDRALFGGSGTYESLMAGIKSAIESGQYRNYPMMKASGAPERSSLDASITAATGAQGADYSGTNVQVAGVDEADVIKTDGRYLYYLANNRLYIVEVGNEKPQVIYEKYFNPNIREGNKTHGENPVEIFLDIENKRLVVILNGYLNENIPYVPNRAETKSAETKPIETKPIETKPDTTKPIDTKTSPGVNAPPIAPDIMGKTASYMMPNTNKQYTMTQVYEISDPKNPKLVRQFTQEGGYLTARLIAGTAYVLSNKYNYPIYYNAGNGTTKESTANAQTVLPKTTSDPIKDIWTLLPANRIGIVPGSDPNAQLIISAISVTKDSQKPELLSLLGASGIVYASQENIYLANYVYNYNQKQPETSKANMQIYRIRITDGKIVANGVGSVPGTAINQFAMDEFNGFFRIATTNSGAFWGGSTAKSESTVYILDKSLQTIGQVGKLGPGETIRSVRFMGDKAYVVTFRTTDPLYVLDLKTPTAPKVLGELKIPGYSAYLHPYGENLLLGFGYEAIVQNNVAYQMGLKVSLFDISDLNNPKERSTIILGGRGSSTELTRNHKALLFSKEKNLIAFPVSLTGTSNLPKEYGGMLFQGLVVMSVENDSKLVLRGGLTNSKRLTSLTGPGFAYNQITKEDQMAISGYDSINRAVYIGDRILTLSSRLIRQYNMDSLKMLSETTLKGFDEFYKYYASDMPAMPEVSAATGKG